MSRAHCFAPIEDAAAIVLILGSMPGRASLAAGEYYAHPRNLFWPIMGELVGAHPGLPYESRLRILKSSAIALWTYLIHASGTAVWILASRRPRSSRTILTLSSCGIRTSLMFSSTASRRNSASGGMYNLRSNPNRCNTCGCRPRARQMQEHHTRKNWMLGGP